MHHFLDSEKETSSKCPEQSWHHFSLRAPPRSSLLMTLHFQASFFSLASFVVITIERWKGIKKKYQDSRFHRNKLPGGGASESLFVTRLIKMIITFNCFRSQCSFSIKEKLKKRKKSFRWFFVFNCGSRTKKKKLFFIKNDLWVFSNFFRVIKHPHCHYFLFFSVLHRTGKSWYTKKRIFDSFWTIKSSTVAKNNNCEAYSALPINFIQLSTLSLMKLFWNVLTA